MTPNAFDVVLARPEKHPVILVEEALQAAGYERGSFAARGMKGEYFDPAVKGFVVKWKRAFEWEGEQPLTPPAPAA